MSQESNAERGSSPILFDDSQNSDGEHPSLEVNSGSRNTSVAADSSSNGMDHPESVQSQQRPCLNLFSSQQEMVPPTSAVSGSSKPKQVKNISAMRLNVVDEDSPNSSLTPLDDDVGSFGSMSGVTDHGTPKTERGKLTLRAKKKSTPVVSSDSEAEVEVVGDTKSESLEDRAAKRPRPSIECVYASTPHRSSSSPFRTADISDEGIPVLKAIPEESDTPELDLHFSPSQDTVPPRQNIGEDAEVDKIAKKDATPEEIKKNSNDSIIVDEEVVHADKEKAGGKSEASVTLESSGHSDAARSNPLSIKSQGSSIPEATSRKKEGYILTKIKYTIPEDESIMENVRVDWQCAVVLEPQERSSSSLRTSSSPHSVSSDGAPRLLFSLPPRKPRSSVLSSSSGSSGGSALPFSHAPRAPLLPSAIKLMDGTHVVKRDYTFEAEKILQVNPAIHQAITAGLATTVHDVPTLHAVGGGNEAETPGEETKEEAEVIMTPTRGRSNSSSTNNKSRGRPKKASAVKSSAAKKAAPSSSGMNMQPEGIAGGSSIFSPEPVASGSGLSATSGRGRASGSRSSASRTSGSRTAALRNQKEAAVHEGEEPWVPGALVFARWKENQYYPGKLAYKENEKWRIEYDDDTSHCVPPEHILIIDKIPTGQPVYGAVMGADDFYYPGIIINHKESVFGLQYEVHLEEQGSHYLMKKNLMLNEEQINLLRKDMKIQIIRTPTQKADVSLDNMMEGKRASRSKRRLLSESPSRGSKRMRDSSQSDNKDCSAGDSDYGAEVWNLEWENQLLGVEKLGSPSLEDYPWSKTKLVTPEMEKQLGPLPKKQIFKGYVFSLAYVVDEPKLSDPESQNSHESDGPDVCFNRNYLIQQLQKGGGTVVDFFDAVHLAEPSKCLMVTNCCNTSAKALICIASEVRSIRHTWVIQSCLENMMQKLDSYWLPVGYTHQKKQPVDWYERPKNAVELFKLRNVGIVGNTGKPFRDFWQQILHKGKARTATIESWDAVDSLVSRDVRVILTDTTCPDATLKSLKDKNIDVVGPTWVVQSLIVGKALAAAKFPHTLDVMSSFSQSF